MAVMATKAMAHIKGIEELPQDCLREILILVAQQPEGAFDIARAFATCKTFGGFVEDRTLLQAVSFDTLFRQFPRKYELFAEAGGLVARCARAGHSTARFMLAKVAMASASKLCCAKMEAGSSNRTVKHVKLCDADRAARFLEHTDKTELLYLMREFLSRAKVWHLVVIKHHLINFVAMYLAPGKTHQFQQLVDILEKLFRNSRPLRSASEPLSAIIKQCNMTATTAYKVLKGLGVEEAQILPLMQCLMPMDDEEVDCKTVLKHLEIVDAIYAWGIVVATNLGNTKAMVFCRCFACMADMIGDQVRDLLVRETFLESSRESLIAILDALRIM